MQTGVRRLSRLMTCTRMRLKAHLAYNRLMKDWSLWVKRVFAFSKLEAKSRGTLRELLGQGETMKEGISKDGKLLPRAHMRKG